MERYIDLYKLKIIDYFEDIIKCKKELDNYNLATIFEYYSCIQLMKKHNEIFMVYNDISVDFKRERELNQNDTGIDFINKKGDYYGQAKLRKKTLSWGEVSTFLAHMFCSDFGTKGVLTYNSGITFSPQLELKKNKLILEPYDKEEFIQYCHGLLLERNNLTNKIKSINKHELRDYQEEATKMIIDNPYENVIINLPTGSGKTVIMSKSMDYNDSKKIYLILIPRVILLDQTRETIEYFQPHYIGKIQLIGDSNRKYKFNPNKNVVICVYNSIDYVLPHISKFYKIYIDEAHHIMRPLIYIEDDEDGIETSDDTSTIDEELNQTYIDKINNLRETDKCVYFSATIDEEEYMVYYHKSVRWMIDKGYLCDYQVKFPIFNRVDDKLVCRYLTDKYRHYIVYCSDRIKGLEINGYLNEYLPCSSGYIDCFTHKKERNDLIKKYKEGVLKYLVNVRVLTEGFDAPITQGVCMMHIPTSKKLLIQILGRMLRLHDMKTMANIILPIMEVEEAVKTAKVMKLLAENDDKYGELFNKKDYKGYIEEEMVRYIEENNGVNSEENDSTYVEFDTEIKHLYDIVFDSMGNSLDNVEKWRYKLGVVKEFIDLNCKRPSRTCKNKEEKILGVWISNQLMNSKDKTQIMKETEIYNLWNEFVNDDKYKEYFMDNMNVWKNNLDKVKEFIDLNCKRPSRTCKNKEEKILGSWIGHQLTNSKNKTHIMKETEIYNLWNEFVNDDKYKEYFNN